MGLIDRLAEKVFDEATAARREGAERRRALRDLALEELRGYSQAVERMRVAFLQAREAVAAAAAEGPNMKREDVLAPARPDEHLGDGIVREALHLGIDRQDASAIAAQFAERAWLNIFGPQALDYHRRARDGRFAGSADFARRRADELDEAWARVRPVLDDALEIEAVVYLRQFRHELRGLVECTFHDIESYWRALDRDRDLMRSRILMGIDELLDFADAWSSHVGGVRKSLS